LPKDERPPCAPGSPLAAARRVPIGGEAKGSAAALMGWLNTPRSTVLAHAKLERTVWLPPSDRPT